MNKIIVPLILIFTVSCSTTFNNYFGSSNSTQSRNEKLMSEDFQVEKDVFDKFKENKIETTKEVSSEKKSAPIKKDDEKKVKTTPTIEKKKNLRTAIRPQPIKRKLKNAKKIIPKQVVKSLYPENFPKKLKDFDKVSGVFWHQFKPVLRDGEEVVLSVSYMGVSTGKITIKTKASTRIGDEEVFHVNARVKTADFYSYLYEVDDMCDSYIKKDGFIPLKFSLIQRQSSQDIDDLQLFDLKALKTYSLYKRVTKEKEKKKKVVKDIPLYFQDPLSVLYFIRGLPMVVNKSYPVPIVNQGKIELLTAKLEKIETISTKLGKKKAYKVRINTKHKGETIKGGDMVFWFSTDERRTFLKFEAKIKIGSISGEIESYKE